MNGMMLGRGTVIVTVAAILALSGPMQAQTTPSTRLTGVIHDYTASLDAFGPWHVVGHWTLALNTASGKVDFLASLTMVRSDNPARMPHTHHIQLSDGQVTPLASGFRIRGVATITLNGNLATFTGSPVDVEITGGDAGPLANVAVTFGGAAASHFGTQLKGVITYQP